MTLKDWIQLAFGLLNGLSFALTFRPSWRMKLVGSCALLVAHPGIAVYFLITHQAFFLVNSVIMTSAGVYGLWRALKLRALELRFPSVYSAVVPGEVDKTPSGG